MTSATCMAMEAPQSPLPEGYSSSISKAFPVRLPKRRFSDPASYAASKLGSLALLDVLPQAPSPPRKSRCRPGLPAPLAINNTEATADGVNWLMLPPEIWYYILKMLREEDLLILEKCCRSLAQFATSDYVWRNLFTCTYCLDEMPPAMRKANCTWKENFFQLRCALHVSQGNNEDLFPATRIKVAKTLPEAVASLQWDLLHTPSTGAPASRLVILHPGVHASTAFTTPATVIGAGALGDVVISSSNSPALSLLEGSGQSVFKDIVFEVKDHVNDDTVNTVEIKGKVSPYLLGCSFTNTTSNGACLLVHGEGAWPYVKNCIFENNPCHGIIVEEHAKGIYEGNTIRHAGQIGIWVLKGANPHFLLNTVHHSGGVGVLLSEDAQAYLDQNDIAYSENSNVEVAGHSNPVLENCTIHDGISGGIYIHEQSSGQYTNCRIHDNQQAGVWIAEHAHPSFIRNEIYNGRQGGVYVFDRGCGLFVDNDIHGNAMTNVQIRDTDSRPIFRSNSIHSSFNGGIHVHDFASPIIKGNRIERNAMAGVWVTTGAKPLIENNYISCGRQVGVFFYNAGLGQLCNNVIDHNKFCGIQIKSLSNPVVSNNVIVGGGSAGVLIHSDGQGILEGNRIIDNVGGNIWVRGSSPVLSNNHIGGSSVGLQITHGSRGVYENNTIFSCTLNGVQVASNAVPVLKGNMVSNCGAYGVEFTNGAGGVLSNNMFTKNALSGIAICSSCSVETFGDNKDHNNNQLFASVPSRVQCPALMRLPLPYVIDWEYLCRTCKTDEDQDVSMCQACSLSCHKGHEVEKVRLTKLKCACGLGLLHHEDSTICKFIQKQPRRSVLEGTAV